MPLKHESLWGVVLAGAFPGEEEPEALQTLPCFFAPLPTPLPAVAYTPQLGIMPDAEEWAFCLPTVFWQGQIDRIRGYWAPTATIYPGGALIVGDPEWLENKYMREKHIADEWRWCLYPSISWTPPRGRKMVSE
jgi:hypothetical protein